MTLLLILAILFLGGTLFVGDAQPPFPRAGGRDDWEMNEYWKDDYWENDYFDDNL